MRPPIRGGAPAPLTSSVPPAPIRRRAGPFAIAPSLAALRGAGYGGAFGAEYRPAGRTEDGLGWMAAARAA